MEEKERGRERKREKERKQHFSTSGCEEGGGVTLIHWQKQAERGKRQRWGELPERSVVRSVSQWSDNQAMLAPLTSKQNVFYVSLTGKLSQCPIKEYNGFTMNNHCLLSTCKNKIYIYICVRIVLKRFARFLSKLWLPQLWGVWSFCRNHGNSSESLGTKQGLSHKWATADIILMSHQWQGGK